MENFNLTQRKKEKLTRKSIIIDGSNVFHALGESGFNCLIADIKKYDPENILIFADANLPRIANMKTISKEGPVFCVPAGIEADNFIIQAANRYKNAVLISNDLFRDYDKKLLSEVDIIRFMMVKSELYYTLDLKIKNPKMPKPVKRHKAEKNTVLSSLKKKKENKTNQFPILDTIFAKKGEINLYPEVD